VAQSQRNGGRPPVPGSPAWWRARAARPRRASALSPEAIVKGATKILDAEGLEALTMRRLATDLGTAPGSLYRHFESRDAVLVAVLDDAIGALAEIDPAGDDFAQRTANMARAVRQLILRRPYLAWIWRTTEQLGPNALRARERVLRVILDAGIPAELAAAAYLTVLHYVIGFTTVESDVRARTAAQRRATERYFRELPDEDYPAIRSLAADLNRPITEQEFELGLEAILASVMRRAGTVATQALPGGDHVGNRDVAGRR